MGYRKKRLELLDRVDCRRFESDKPVDASLSP